VPPEPGPDVQVLVTTFFLFLICDTKRFQCNIYRNQMYKCRIF
jgi:hypothetical protein